MTTQIAPTDETARLAAVEEVALASDTADAALDAIVALAAEAFATPISVVSLTGASAQSALAAHGVGRVSVPREFAICTHTVAGDATLIVPDASLDPRLQNNPFVASAPHARFYAGVVLRSAEGHALGTLCIIDTAPRATFSADDEHRLIQLARLAEQRLQARALQTRLSTADEARREAETRAHEALGEAIGAFVACDRLLLNLEGRARAGIMRTQRAVERDGQASEEIAALWDLIDEMAAIARFDRKRADVALYEPSGVVRTVVTDLAPYAEERHASLELVDDAAGVEMLGDSWRFEELIESAVGDCIRSTQGPIALRCVFETLPTGDEVFAVHLSAEHPTMQWRLSARNRELIDAMAGGWGIAAGALTLFLPARLRTRKTVRREGGDNIVSFERSRKRTR